MAARQYRRDRGPAGLFVIDSGYLPSRARADIALIRRVSDKPVRFLMTTHWHFDHNNGASAYRDAYPGVTLLAERNTARWIELNQEYWKALSTAAASPRRAAIAELAPEVAAKRRAELAELETLEVVKPTFLFDGRLSLDFEGTPIEIEDRGRANSPNDATIWLPRERILFAGDILVRSPLPYVGASWPVHWVSVLRDLEAVPAAAIVPGHGPVQTDHAYTRSVRELLEATLERVEALVAGRTQPRRGTRHARPRRRTQARARLEWPCSERTTTGPTRDERSRSARSWASADKAGSDCSARAPDLLPIRSTSSSSDGSGGFSENSPDASKRCVPKAPPFSLPLIEYWSFSGGPLLRTTPKNWCAMRIAEAVTGTSITDSPNAGTVPLASLTPVANVFPCSSILT